MAKKKNKKEEKQQFDFVQFQEKIGRQFQNLDANDPSLWPVFPRALLFLAIIIGVAAAFWFIKITDFEEELQREQDVEKELRQEYTKKLAKAVSLEELKQQRQQVQQYVVQLEKQLPSKAEMSALLSDINQAGLGRSLQFELFRPGQIVVNDYYAELPIAIRVTGKFHDIGSFAADVAGLSRIVTLNNLSLAPQQKDNTGSLVMEATARTFRYLDPDEIQAAAAEKKKKEKGK